MSATRSARRIIAIGGGKGGVGRSLLAANVGIYLSTLGKRVVLLDADLGGANLHTFVGVERPRVTLGDHFEKRVARLEDVVVETAVPGLGLVSGAGDPSWIANPRPAQKFRLLNQVQKLEVDYLVVDLGAGSGFHMLDFFLVADVGVLVVVPEPTSVENSVRFMKSAFLRGLKSAGLEAALGLVREGDHAFEGGIPAPLDIFQAARENDPPLAESLLAEIRAFRPRIVVNQVRAKSDLDLGPALVSAARRRLGITIEYLGHLEHDDAVWHAVRKRRPLLVAHPESRVAKGVERVTRRLLSTEGIEPTPSTKLPGVENHYDVLECNPAASEEEIRRAYRRVREVYGAESIVISGLYDSERLSALHLQIDEAYDTLMDPTRRKAYDLQLFPDGLPPRRKITTPPVGMAAPSILLREEPDGKRSPKATPPPEPHVDATTVFTGALLRQVREARSIELATISEKTKVGAGHFRAIEEERWDSMPAPVYVRGFLVEYAKFLRLDVARVVATYLERYRAARLSQDDGR
ncbi:MAG: helix-turn-helix domain-containing protein [Deltaproteobacteria bacterium]|nr:helix-turn-helix domain-containing protein [Deltaproteobacteria bacterium]